MPDAAIAEFPTPILKEKQKPDIKLIATAIKEIGNEIIDDKQYPLEKEQKPTNLAWIINGEDVVPDPSFSALQLKAAIEHGSIGGSRGIKISFRNITPELNLTKKYGSDIPQGLAVEFLQRLGATLPTDQQGWEKLYDNPVISNPRSSFYVECIVDTDANGRRKLVGFTLIQKDVELLAAA